MQRQGWVTTNRAHAAHDAAGAEALERARDPGHAKRIDAVADHGQDRGQQADRGEHGGDHRDRRGVAQRGHQGNRRHEQRDEREDHRAPREHDRGPRGGDRGGDRVVGLETLGSLGAVAHDEEQRVVDPDPEADHRRQRRRDRRHLGHVAEQADQRQADHQPDRGRDDRQPHRDERPEGEGEDHHRGGDPDPLARLGRRLGELAADLAAGGDLHPRPPGRLGGVQVPLRDLLGQLLVADRRAAPG